MDTTTNNLATHLTLLSRSLTEVMRQQPQSGTSIQQG